MEFTIPTTTEEMYETLNLIYKHYRTSVPIFREEELEIMVIPTLDNTFPTEEELLEESQKSLAPAQTERRDKLKREIENRISEISNLLIHLEEEKTEKLEDLEQEYASKIIKTEKELTGRGLGASLVGVDEINKIVSEKTAMLGNLKMQYGIKKAELLSEKERLIESLEGVDSVYASLCENELVAKVTELKKEYEKRQIETQKYNDSVYEKNLKYRNVILQTRASLELKFMEVRKEYTTSELIEMGYYNDALDCVMGYLQTLSDSVAYRTICDEYKLVQYLDQYYEPIVALFRQKSAS